LKHERAMVGDIGRSEQLFGSVVKLARRVTINDQSAIDDPEVRTRLVELQGWLETQRYSSYMQMSRNLKGEDPGPISLMNKLSSTNFAQLVAALVIELIGDDSLLLVEGRRGEGNEHFMGQFLGSLGISIAGGTSNIQRNIIAERGYGLPRDPAMADRR
jgi:alkylation response protein AidB-like acyl-CoA dehydrogenase